MVKWVLPVEMLQLKVSVNVLVRCHLVEPRVDHPSQDPGEGGKASYAIQSRVEPTKSGHYLLSQAGCPGCPEVD